MTVGNKQEQNYINSQETIAELLPNLPGFLGLTADEYDKLIHIARIDKIENEAVIFREGEKADNLYTVLNGRVHLESYVPSLGPLEVFVAEPLDMFGWEGMTINVRQRITLARALTPTTLISFEGKALRHLCEEDHHIGYIIMRRVVNVIAGRLLSTRLQLYDAIVHISIDDNED
jgi:CRP/FNR family transcriptional regulator, cyclic AMP receptor protein